MQPCTHDIVFVCFLFTLVIMGMFNPFATKRIKLASQIHSIVADRSIDIMYLYKVPTAHLAHKYVTEGCFVEYLHCH